jgi:purine-nucleoside phosphorylase
MNDGGRGVADTGAAYHRAVQEAAACLREAVAPEPFPGVAVVLGSGLGAYPEAMADRVTLPYSAIPHMPRSGVAGHEGRLVVGLTPKPRDGRPPRRVAAFAGRVHLYEGHDLRTVTFAVRVMAAAGVKALVLTNAAGAVNTAFAAGDLMVIDDHINLQGTNPLIGPNDDRFGPRFPDMSEVYSRRLRGIADASAARLGVTLRHGVYAALTGPSYETPAEIRFLRLAGVDAVGMSTVPEAIVARHMGLEVLGLSCLTNMAAGVLDRPLSHQEVIDAGVAVREVFSAVLTGVLTAV